MTGTSYFQDEEFVCKCGCGKVYVHPKLLNLLEKTREIYGKPIIIESGYRCFKHNAEVGGVPGSAHLTGEAADLRCTFGPDRFALLNIFFALAVKRIGIARNYIHVDVSETLPQDQTWLYSNNK